MSEFSNYLEAKLDELSTVFEKVRPEGYPSPSPNPQPQRLAPWSVHRATYGGWQDYHSCDMHLFWGCIRRYTEAAVDAWHRQREATQGAVAKPEEHT